jgi:hypothetical protein
LSVVMRKRAANIATELSLHRLEQNNGMLNGNHPATQERNASSTRFN